MPKADAKNQMLNTVCQNKTCWKSNAKEIKHDLSSISTHRKSLKIYIYIYIKKKKNEREKWVCYSA